jgi:ATP-dependent exoDNAse (exonuclease V) alpha subunit
LVFGGSAHRIQGVEACDGLRILEKESRLKSAPLTQVQRQTAKGYREAIQQMKRNPKRAFEKLNAMGAVREVRLPDRAQAIAQAYTELKTRSQDALVVCPTRDEIDPVTESIRSALKQAGELGKGVQLTGDVSLNWSIAQKSEMHNFRAGQLLGFHRAVKGIAKNETVEVLWAEDKRLIVRNESGQARAITARQARSFDVLDRKGIEVAPADKLLLTGNSRTGFRCTHGEIVTVSHLDSKGGIHLQDGRVLPRNFRKFAYGYAVTAHRSQGMSADTVIISADGMPKESFYVAASWGRKRVLALTSDKQLLRETVARAGARSPAAELARKARPGLRQGICRNLAAARILAIHAAQRLYSRQRRQTLQQTPGNHGISR